MYSYDDFTIRFVRRSDGQLETRASCAKGDAGAELTLPLAAAEIASRFDRAIISARRGAASARAAHYEVDNPGADIELGTALYSAIFCGDVLARFFQLLGKTQEGQGVRIRLCFDMRDPEQRDLAAIPWEFMRRADNSRPLNLTNSTPVVRYIDAPATTQAVEIESALRVLVVISSPKGTGALNLGEERTNIETTWAEQAGVAVDFLENPTPQRLQDSLATSNPHVLHFMGHGTHDPDSGRGALVLQNDDGTPHPYDAEQLAVLLGDATRLRLVFLNACDTAQTADASGAQPMGGVAIQLVQAGVTAVLAMQYPISDRGAIAFSRSFYRNLAHGFPVDYAANEGRKAIFNEDKTSFEWGTPVLFMRSDDGLLFKSTQLKAKTKSGSDLAGVKFWSIALGAVGLVAVGLWAWWPSPDTTIGPPQVNVADKQIQLPVRHIGRQAPRLSDATFRYRDTEDTLFKEKMVFLLPGPQGERKSSFALSDRDATSVVLTSADEPSWVPKHVVAEAYPELTGSDLAIQNANLMSNIKFKKITNCELAINIAAPGKEPKQNIWPIADDDKCNKFLKVAYE